MKPTSIIFLILSIILIATGVGLCFVAENMSTEQEIELYTQSIDENDNNIDRYELENADLSRISLILKKADVNIITNSDETYIELINFSKNTYEFLLNLKTVSVDDTINLLSLLNFAEGGFKFEGLRYFLTPDMYKDKQKVVNIYLKNDNSLKVIDIKIGEGDLKIDNLIPLIDYTISVEKGNTDFYKIRSSSVFNLDIGEGNVKFTDTIIMNANVKINQGDFNLQTKDYIHQTYNLTTTMGKIFYGDDEKYGTFYQDLPIATTKTKVEIGTGDINIKISE